MTTEDLQERYRNKRGEINPETVPLAADSAHLLTEYLDSISVELVRRGVGEPYRITREFEEIFVQELQQLGSKYKLTYDITSKMLEGYGTPRSVVDAYINEHQPKIHQLLAREPTQKTRKTMEKPEKAVWQGLVWLILAGTIIAQAIMSIMILNRSVYVGELIMSYPFFCLGFIYLEIISGLMKKTWIEEKYYRILRETIRFLFTFFVLETLWVLTAKQQSWEGYGTWLIVSWGIVYGIGWLRDHSELLWGSDTKNKPIARFLLPSYILLGIAYVGGLWYLSNNFYRDVGIAVLFMGLAALSLLMDIRRRYPLSFKKIGYTSLFTLLPLMGFRYFDEVFTVTVGWLVVFGLLVVLLFRAEIKTQLGEYQRQISSDLEGYREQQ